MNHIKSVKEKADTIFITNNKYIGKSRFHIAFAPKTSLIFSLVYLSHIIFIRSNTDLSPYEALLAVLLVIGQMLYFRIRVSAKGIKYKDRFFKWDQIQTIGIAVTKHNVPHKFYYKMIYISKHKHEKPVHLYHSGDGGTRGAYTKVEKITQCNDIPRYLIVASFNRRLIHHIMANWRGEIVNLENTPGWKCYVKWHNFFDIKMNR